MSTNQSSKWTATIVLNWPPKGAHASPPIWIQKNDPQLTLRFRSLRFGSEPSPHFITLTQTIFTLCSISTPRKHRLLHSLFLWISLTASWVSLEFSLSLSLCMYVCMCVCVRERACLVWLCSCMWSFSWKLRFLEEEKEESMGCNAFLKNLCGCLQEERRLGFPWRIVQELGCMTVILLQERLKKQVSLSLFIFTFMYLFGRWKC